MVKHALEQLIAIQRTADRQYFQDGLFPSQRKYPVLKLSRPDDNVYFTAYILHILKENREKWNSLDNAVEIANAISKGEQALQVYRHGKDNISFNYYRKDGYFPNGKLLSKHQHFEPANDADDSSVAFLGLDYDKATALQLQEKFAYHANGKRNRWVKRIPKAYRHFETYNTWLGTDRLYVDLDVGVLCNILQFIAKYQLPQTPYEEQAVQFLEKAILSGDYLKKAHLVAAWYPDHAIVVYFISRVVKTGYFTFAPAVLQQLKKDTQQLHSTTSLPVQKMLIETALYNLGLTPPKATVSLEAAQQQTNFSIGIIPIPHPWNSLWAQELGKLNSLRITYHSEALQIALWLERAFLDL
tara:strand:+ start:3486 stop:4553 length:1068 start_codon:yes stop_codon:yes gene_type:complete